MEVPNSGYQEIEHTADTALFVWGPDLPAIFIEAAKGINLLMGMQIDQERRDNFSISLTADEAETLLVNFLEEIIFLGEHEGVGFDEFTVKIDGEYCLAAELQGAAITQKAKEIKAVTFHNLDIKPTDSGYEVTIVFDV